MDSFIVDVGRYGGNITIRVAVCLLLVADEMLLFLSVFMHSSKLSSCGT